MTYEQWRISYQDSEQAARVAFRAWQDAEQERDQLKADVERLELKLGRMYDDMLYWRGIDRESGDEPCNVCSGSGVRSYGTTSTWRGGIGGCVITSDVCDRCWGSGVKDSPWTNLRQRAQEQTK